MKLPRKSDKLPNDPVERIIADALNNLGIEWEQQQHNGALDFFLPNYNLHIECKQFYTERVTKQLELYPDVVLIQGRKAAEQFAIMLFDLAG